MNEQAIMRVKRRLIEEAKKKFPHDAERQNRYIFGTLNRIKKQ